MNKRNHNDGEQESAKPLRGVEVLLARFESSVRTFRRPADKPGPGGQAAQAETER